jgi:hypothetical protein
MVRLPAKWTCEGVNNHQILGQRLGARIGPHRTNPLTAAPTTTTRAYSSSSPTDLL